MRFIHVGITGADGFIGGWIKKKLEVIDGVVVHSISYLELFNSNSKKLAEFAKKNDVIIHAAAATRESNLPLIAGNIVASYNLLTAVEKNNKASKIIFLSSSAVDVKKRLVYGDSKYLVELMLEDFSRLYKRRVSIFRLTNVFGEGSRPFHNTAVATFCYQVAKGEKLKVNKKGAPLMLVYVGDVVSAISEEVFKKRKELFFFKKIYTKNIITVPALAKLITSFKNLKNQKNLKSKFHKDLYKTYLSFVYGK
jgi:UDP-2-acetamido-2,6-beta-L-arabino-hexul-4-ose reductase